MKRLSRYLSDDWNTPRFYRKRAVVIGALMLLVMTMQVAVCAMYAMDRKTPEQLLYVSLPIAACFWMEVMIVLAIHYSGKMWPSVLIFVTSAAYIVGIFTAALSIVGLMLLWLSLAIAVVGGAKGARCRD